MSIRNDMGDTTMAQRILLILAAGIGSRFGGGIKQLSPVDDYGHLIIDYSIHDAIAAGFNKLSSSYGKTLRQTLEL